MSHVTRSGIALWMTVMAGCAGEGPQGPPASQGPAPVWAPIEIDDPIGRAAATALAGVADVEASVSTLAHRIRQPIAAALDAQPSPETCQPVEDALWSACTALAPRPCWAMSTFYWAHDIPRCTGRLQVGAGAGFADLYVIDFAGASRVDPHPGCGDTIVAGGETCDDGNRDPFDGCDPDCQTEPFEGCETVIQQEFSAADIAWIDATRWQSPRSHVMVHHDVEPFAVVDERVCDRAAAAAAAVCTRLADEMPFVSGCAPEVHLTDATTCEVRLRVSFLRPEPDSGVFTTSLEGVLAFTLEGAP